MISLDKDYMRRALRLARQGSKGAPPNPLVGCVLVRDGRIVGEGYHARFGGPHAEVAALRSAGPRARGSTAYISLEPCSHWGKTPPCTQALIRAGVSRVVAAMRDPNLRVSGRGIVELREAGIEVRTGLLESQARRLNRPYLEALRRSRPYVILKAAQTLDGKLQAASGRSKWITGKPARRLAHRWRSEVDAVLVGRGTVQADNPSLTSHGAGPNPVRIVLDPWLRLPKRARVLDGKAPTWLASSRKSLGALRRGRRTNGHLSLLTVRSRNGGLDLRDLLRQLSRRGISTLMVEGGSAVLTSFLEEGLADEMRLFVAPKLLGGENARGIFEGRGRNGPDRALQLKAARVARVGKDYLVTGRLAF